MIAAFIITTVIVPMIMLATDVVWIPEFRV
jgi:hypothetical protein